MAPRSWIWLSTGIMALGIGTTVKSVSAEDVTLLTQDGVQLVATYFPSPRPRGKADPKQVTPVVLLHDYKSTRAVFYPLAQRLTAPKDNDEPGFAVLTVDLRAHGDSTKQTLPDASTIDLDSSRLRRQDFMAMAEFDMEAIRSFLVSKNDQGELNLNKLCLVGSGMGASIAANWALKDWTAPPLAIVKQGQDVKAIVLISPSWSFNGLSFQAPMRFAPLKQNVAWLLMCGGEDTKAQGDLRRIFKQLERFHPEPSRATGKQQSSLVVIEWPSKLQGDLLIKQLGTSLEEQLIKFLTEQVSRKQHPWLNRRGRLPEGSR